MPPPPQQLLGRERLEQALRAADAAGDTEAATHLAAALRAAPAVEQPTDVEAPAADTGIGAAALEGASQGATLGFGDELSAASTITEDRDKPLSEQQFHTPQEAMGAYDERLARERSNLSAARAAHPVATGVGEVAGAVAVPSMGLARGAGVLRNAPNWLRMIGAGAASGATYGAGTAGEGDVSRAEGAMGGGAAGAVLGPAVGALSRPLMNVGLRLGRIGVDKMTATPRRQAEREVARALQTDLADPEALARLQRMQSGTAPPQMTMADVGENTAGLARAAAAKPGPFRTDAQAILTPRQEGQQGRLIARMPTTPNSGTQAFKDTFDEWAESRITSARPLYEQAYAASFDASSPQMKALLGRPAMQDALREAERQIGNEAGIKGGNVQRLDLAKRYLDDNIGEAVRKGRNNEARMLGQTKNELVAEMDRQVPEYAQARQAFAGEAAVRDAGNLGSDLFKPSISHDDARRAVADMTDSESQAFRRGALRSLVETLEKTPESRNAAGKLVESVAMRDKMRLLFSDQAAFERFVQQAGDEAQMTYTRNKVLSGSPTARILEEGKALTSAGEVLADAATGNKLGLFSRFLRTLGVGDISNDTLREMSALLLQQQNPRLIGRIGRMATTPRLGTISPATQAGTSAFVGAEMGQQR